MHPLHTLDHLSLARTIHEARSSTPWDDASDHARNDAYACAVAAAGWFASMHARRETFVPIAEPANAVLAAMRGAMSSEDVEARVAERLAVELERDGGPYGDEPEIETAVASLGDRFARPAMRLVPREAGE